MADDDSSATPLSPADRDWVIRTAAGEDANNPAAIASVIKNRQEAGGYGDRTNSPKSIVLKPYQFSMWNGLTGAAGGKGANDIGMTLDPGSDQYKKIGGVVDDVWSGKAEDPTNGATHYYNPKGASPSWGPSMADPVAIGAHLYGKADVGGDSPSEMRRAGTTLTSIPDFSTQPGAAVGPSKLQAAMQGLGNLSSSKPASPGDLMTKGLALMHGDTDLAGDPQARTQIPALMEAPPIMNRSQMLQLAPQIGQQLSGYAPQVYGVGLNSMGPQAPRPPQQTPQQGVMPSPYGTSLSSMQMGFGMTPQQLSMLMSPWALDQDTG